MNRTHLFHCTQFDFGPALRFLRQSPIQGPMAGEPTTPRLCCCESVPDCFSAKLFFCNKPVFVYRTEQPVNGVKPVGVWDSFVTGERWIVHPVPIQKVDVIPPDLVKASHRPLWYYHNTTKQASDLKLRIASLAIAWRVFGKLFEHPERRRFAERAARRTKIGDPFKYVLDRTMEIGGIP